MNKEALKIADDVFETLKGYTQPGIPLYHSKIAYKKMLHRVLSAIVLPESSGIVVYGDYDHDGITSAIILQRYLRKIAILFRGVEEGDDFVKIAYSSRQNSFGMTEEEFSSFSAGNKLVITVDNGSDIPFLSEDMTNLIVIDHHPTDNMFDFIINPNMHPESRIDENSSPYYSTSGGKVVYDFILNLDKNIGNFCKIEYKEDYHYMKVLSVLAATTLISDMATMDKYNREFVKDALFYLKNNAEKIPFSILLNGDFSSRSLSFNLISLVNAVSRMEEDFSIAENLLAPVAIDDFLEAEKAVNKINESKKKIVSQTLGALEIPSSGAGIFYLGDKPIGILGLIANRLSGENNKRPVFCFGRRNDGVLVMSGRGINSKKIAGVFIDALGLNGDFGGHDEACGGSFPAGEGNTEGVFEKIRHYLSDLSENRPSLFGANTVPVIFEQPVDMETFFAMNTSFSTASGSVGFKEKVLVPVVRFGINASYQSSSSDWTLLELNSLDTPSKKIKGWVDPTMIHKIEEALDRSPDSSILLLELETGGGLSIYDCFPDSYSLGQAVSLSPISLHLSGKRDELSRSTLNTPPKKQEETLFVFPSLGDKSPLHEEDMSELERYTESVAIPVLKNRDGAKLTETGGNAVSLGTALGKIDVARNLGHKIVWSRHMAEGMRHLEGSDFYAPVKEKIDSVCSILENISKRVEAERSPSPKR